MLLACDSHDERVRTTPTSNRVIRVGLTGPRRLPVFRWNRTSSGPVAMSWRCQRRICLHTKPDR